jgi:polysaccharide export outer membrane protein
VLQITIGGENEQTVQYINQYFAAGGLTATVDINGFIELPKIGKIKVAGLSKEEVRDTLVKAYKEYLIDPIVNVKFGDFRFSVMGEVRTPGTYEVPGEKLNILEALTRAGDMTEFAVRDKVKIIRDINGRREVISVNLNDRSLLNSPDFYINRYDVIFVESKNLKLMTENVQRPVAYIVEASGIIALLLSLMK